MRSEKFHRTLIGIAFLIIAFMYADTYLAPPRWNAEIVRRTVEKRPTSGIRYKRAPTYQLFTDDHHYYVTSQIYNAVGIGDSILVDRSWLSYSLKGVRVANDGIIYETDLGFISSGSGVFFTLFFGIVSLLAWLFYGKISYHAGRVNLSIFLLIISTGLLVVYFFNGF